MLKLFKNPVIATITFLTILLFVSGCGRTSSMSTTELLDKATIYGSNGQWKYALKYAAAAADREPGNVSALILKAIACEYCGKDELALESARQAVKVSPDNFMAQYTLGRLYAQSNNKVQDAIAPLLRALAIKHNDQNAMILLARCSDRLNLDKTIEYYNSLATDQRITAGPEIWNQMGIYYATRNNLKAAAASFVRAYNASPDNNIVVLNFAIFLDRYMHNTSRAAKYYQKYLELTAKNPQLDKKRANIEQRIKVIASK
ncbi:MAG: tetratricopeptide repeat protein [Victivallaceae bacterium]